VEGERLKESQAINSSLSTLSKVICAMKKKDDIIPYRETMLTFILYECLSSPSAKILMIVNLNPISLNESLCSLKFA
jgi:kinesin family protein C1